MKNEEKTDEQIMAEGMGYIFKGLFKNYLK